MTTAPDLPRRLAAEFLGNPVVSFADAALGGLRWRDAATYRRPRSPGA